jgi:hypothetical protein
MSYNTATYNIWKICTTKEASLCPIDVETSIFVINDPSNFLNKDIKEKLHNMHQGEKVWYSYAIEKM